MRVWFAALLVVSLTSCERSPSRAPVAPRLFITDTDKPEPVSAIPEETPVVDAHYARLGARLFRDKRLSVDGSVACSSCHDPSHGFAGAAALPVGAHGIRAKLNAPSLENLVYDSMYGWYGIRTSLEKQVEVELESADRMGMDASAVTKKLAASDADVQEFRGAFVDGLTPSNLVCALSDYLRTRVTPGSKFDQSRIRDTPLTSGEAQGYRLFKSWGCANCHQGRNLGGTLLSKVDLEHVGDGEIEIEEKDARPELGRWLETHGPETKDDVYMFRVPPLRNVGLTPPYFRDGSVATLEAAVLRESERQMGHRFSDVNSRDIADFLRSLSSEPVKEPE